MGCNTHIVGVVFLLTLLTRAHSVTRSLQELSPDIRNQSEWIVTLQLISFSNPNGWNSLSKRCDTRSLLNPEQEKCDHIFNLCVKIADGKRSCWKTKEPVSEHEIKFKDYKDLASVRQQQILVSGPYTSLATWLYVTDQDGRAEELVDEFTFNLEQEERFPATNKITGNQTKTSLEVRVEVNCQENYYGNNCTIFCEKDADCKCEETGIKCCLRPDATTNSKPESTPSEQASTQEILTPNTTAPYVTTYTQPATTHTQSATSATTHVQSTTSQTPTMTRSHHTTTGQSVYPISTTESHGLTTSSVPISGLTRIGTDVRNESYWVVKVIWIGLSNRGDMNSNDSCDGKNLFKPERENCNETLYISSQCSNGVGIHANSKLTAQSLSFSEHKEWSSVTNYTKQFIGPYQGYTQKVVLQNRANNTATALDQIEITFSADQRRSTGDYIGNFTRLRAKIDVKCQTNHYGNDCNVYCDASIRTEKCLCASDGTEWCYASVSNGTTNYKPESTTADQTSTQEILTPTTTISTRKTPRTSTNVSSTTVTSSATTGRPATATPKITITFNTTDCPVITETDTNEQKFIEAFKEAMVNSTRNTLRKEDIDVHQLKCGSIIIDFSLRNTSGTTIEQVVKNITEAGLKIGVKLQDPLNPNVQKLLTFEASNIVIASTTTATTAETPKTVGVTLTPRRQIDYKLAIGLGIGIPGAVIIAIIIAVVIASRSSDKKKSKKFLRARMERDNGAVFDNEAYTGL